MRAIAVSTFGAEPALVELPKPEPGAGEVRVRIEYAALNPCDWQAARGSPDAGPAPRVFPLVVGVDFAGRVDMIGCGANRFRVGDQVFGRIGDAQDSGRAGDRVFARAGGRRPAPVPTASSCPSRRTPPSPSCRPASPSVPRPPCRPPG